MEAPCTLSFSLVTSPRTQSSQPCTGKPLSWTLHWFFLAAVLRDTPAFKAPPPPPSPGCQLPRGNGVKRSVSLFWLEQHFGISGLKSNVGVSNFAANSGTSLCLQSVLWKRCFSGDTGKAFRMEMLVVNMYLFCALFPRSHVPWRMCHKIPLPDPEIGEKSHCLVWKWFLAHQLHENLALLFIAHTWPRRCPWPEWSLWFGSNSRYEDDFLWRQNKQNLQLIRDLFFFFKIYSDSHRW